MAEKNGGPRIRRQPVVVVDTCPPPSLDVENPSGSVYIYIYNKTRVAWEGLQFLTQSMGCPENHLGLSFAFLGVMKSKLFLFVCLHRFTEKVYKMVGAPLRSN